MPPSPSPPAKHEIAISTRHQQTTSKQDLPNSILNLLSSLTRRAPLASPDGKNPLYNPPPPTPAEENQPIAQTTVIIITVVCVSAFLLIATLLVLRHRRRSRARFKYQKPVAEVSKARDDLSFMATFASEIQVTPGGGLSSNSVSVSDPGGRSAFDDQVVEPELETGLLQKRDDKDGQVKQSEGNGKTTKQLQQEWAANREEQLERTNTHDMKAMIQSSRDIRDDLSSLLAFEVLGGPKKKHGRGPIFNSSAGGYRDLDREARRLGGPHAGRDRSSSSGSGGSSINSSDGNRYIDAHGDAEERRHRRRGSGIFHGRFEYDPLVAGSDCGHGGLGSRERERSSLLHPGPDERLKGGHGGHADYTTHEWWEEEDRLHRRNVGAGQDLRIRAPEPIVRLGRREYFLDIQMSHMSLLGGLRL